MLRVILAGIFSFLFPGIGQIFNNQWLKGIILALVELSILYFIVPNMWITILFRVIWLYAIVDAVVIALRARRGLAKSKGLNGIQAVAGVGIAMLLVLPLAWFPTYLPDYIYSLAAKSEQNIEDNVPEDQMKEEEKEYMEYLEDKYGEKFIFTENRYDSLFDHYVFEVRPENDDELTFIVFQDEHDEFNDTYIRDIWTRDANKQFDPFINELYDNVWLYDLKVILGSGDDQQILEENETIPSFEESAEKYAQNYNYSVMIYVIQDMDDENMQGELERMYEVITFFEENNITAYNYEIEYYNEEIIDHIDEDTKPDVVEHSEYASFFLSLGEKEFAEISSPKDIEQYLVDLRE